MLFEGFESDLIGVGEASVFVRYGGAGLPVLLLHGHPCTFAAWHRVAPLLREQGFAAVCADLREYGRSRSPVPAADHSGYSKRAVARDMLAAMRILGHERFARSLASWHGSSWQEWPGGWLRGALPAAGSPLDAKTSAAWPDEPIDLRYPCRIFWISRWVRRWIR
jgi:alpha/beta hydrolase family protein